MIKSGKNIVKVVRAKTKLINHIDILEHYKDDIKDAISNEAYIKLSNIDPSPFHYATVELHLTNTCNLKCSYCSYHSADKAQTLSIDSIMKVKKFKPKTITLAGGGEPTVYRHSGYNFSEAVKILKEETGASIGLITNGKSFPEGNLKELLEWVRVSVDANSEETYTHLKGDNSLFKVKQNVLRYVDSGIPVVGVGFLMNQDNVLEFPEFLYDMYLADAGRNAINVQQRPIHGNKIDRPSLEQVKKVALEIDSLMQRDANFGEFVKCSSNAENLRTAFDNVSPWKAQNHGESSHCYFSLLFILINANGEIYPCRSHSEKGTYLLGNIDSDVDSIIAKQVEKFVKVHPCNCPNLCRDDSTNKATCNYLDSTSGAIDISPHLFI